VSGEEEVYGLSGAEDCLRKWNYNLMKDISFLIIKATTVMKIRLFVIKHMEV
jgi:hypothetical protein